MITKDTLINAGLLAAGGAVIATGSFNMALLVAGGALRRRVGDPRSRLSCPCEERQVAWPSLQGQGWMMDAFKRHITGFRGRKPGRHGTCPCCRETSVSDSRQLARTRLKRDLRTAFDEVLLLRDSREVNG